MLAIVQPGNAGSIRVLEKLRFSDAGMQEFNGQALQVYSLQAPR